MRSYKTILTALALLAGVGLVFAAGEMRPTDRSSLRDAAAGTLPTGSVGSGEIEDGAIVDADVSASAALALSKLACAGAGAPVAGVASSSEQHGGYIKTVLTFTNAVEQVADGGDKGGSLKVADFDDGAFTLFMAVADCSLVTTGGATNTFVASFGTAAAADDNGLTGTEADIIPSTSIDTTAGTVFTNAFDGVLAAPANFDGTATAKDLYWNWAMADSDMEAAVTNTLTGTLTLWTSDPTDN